MQVLRLLVLFGALFGLGLFIQPSAYASAHPAIAASAVSHCGMMNADRTAGDMSQEEGECEDMQVDCVFTTACISPLHKPDEASLGRSPVQGERLYARMSSDEPLTSSRGPEPPPPQVHS